jgi:hypothetical protein
MGQPHSDNRQSDPMNFTPSTRSTVFHFSALNTRVENACDWAQIDRGRATRYARLVTEFFDGRGNSQEHVLAYHEANEIAEIYRLWSGKVEEFPGLKNKISETFTSGALIVDGENLATSSNRPRNDGFVFFVAGRLLAAECEVLAVDGINRLGENGHWTGDITIRKDGIVLDVQCKRPRSRDAIDRNVTQARKQILNAISPRRGFIAIDASVIIRPKGTLLAANSVASASGMLSKLVQPHAESLAQALNFSANGDATKLYKEIAGLIWFASLPCMVKEPSRVIRPLGDRYEITRPYSATEVAISLNDTSPYRAALLTIGEQLKRWLEDKWN